MISLGLWLIVGGYAVYLAHHHYTGFLVLTMIACYIIVKMSITWSAEYRAYQQQEFDPPKYRHVLADGYSDQLYELEKIEHVHCEAKIEQE